MEITDVMVDLETTGATLAICGILQIGAIKFNIQTGEVDPNVFDRCPALLPYKVYDQGGSDFWNKHANVHRSIIARQEEALPVYEDFAQWLSGYPKPLRFWSKPLSFDWPFLALHYGQLGLEMPFAYRTARDLNTWISRSLGVDAEHVDMKHVEDAHTGPLHNALSDCVLQLKMLREVSNWGGDTYISKPVVDAEFEEVTQ